MKTHFVATTFVALGLALAAPAHAEHEHAHGDCCGHDHAAEPHHHADHAHAAEEKHEHHHDHAEHAHEHHHDHDHAAEEKHEHHHDHAEHAHEHKHEHADHDHSSCSAHDHAHDQASEGHQHDHSTCSGDHGHDHAQGSGAASAIVKADARSRYMLRMKLEEVPQAGLYLTHSLYGYLTVPSHAMETYALPCSGKITMSVKTAQSVKKGDELYSLVSPEIIERTAGVQQAESALNRCKEEVQTLKARLDRLVTVGTSNSELESQHQFKEAEQRQLQRDLDVARARLNMLVMGAETEMRDGVTTLVVRAHADGMVRNVGVNQGSWGEQGAAVVTMSNTAAMEVEATLYASDQPEVTEIRATMLSGRMQEAVSGTWRIDEQIDTARQTRSLYFTPDTLPQDARAGQLCRLDLYRSGANSKTVNIPDSAVVRVGLDDVVFVEVSEGTYAMVKVHAAGSRRGMTPVEGLIPGQRIVVKGGNELRYLLPSDGKQKKAGHFHADGKFHEGDHHE